jgi:type II secretory pathway pseudopilin PulG
MIDERENVIVPQEAATPRWVGIGVVVLAIISLVALGVGWSAENASKNNQQALTAQVQADKQAQTVLEQRLQQSAEAQAQVQGEVTVITNRLKLTQSELANARYQAKKIKDMDSKQFAAFQEQQQQVTSQLATKASSDDVNKLSGDVNGVKTDLDSTKQNLQMARDQFGNLIARNHDEIAQLRLAGERNIYEFTVDKKGERKHVGSLNVELRNTNTKKQLFSIYLYVDDKRFEKKNRSVDEPIYFYTHDFQAPLELVVNQVGKNKVTGYVSVPKAAGTTSQTAAATGTGE